MTSSKTTVEKAANLIAFFRSELQSSFRQIGLETHEDTEAYLAHLLEGFARVNPEIADELGFEKPAAFLLCEAMNSPGEERIEAYRRLGDASLFNCGFFSGYLTRREVDGKYYRQVGRVAYQNLVHLMEYKSSGGAFQLIFGELATKFDSFVEALRRLGGASSSNSAETRQAIIERLRAGEAVNAEELRRAGLLADSDEK